MPVDDELTGKVTLVTGAVWGVAEGQRTGMRTSMRTGHSRSIFQNDSEWVMTPEDVATLGVTQTLHLRRRT